MIQCFRTGRGVEVLDYILPCYKEPLFLLCKEPFISPALGQCSMSGTFSSHEERDSVSALLLVVDVTPGKKHSEQGFNDDGESRKATWPLHVVLHSFFISVQIK